MNMEEMIKKCEEQRKEGEVIVFAVGVGRVIPMMGRRKTMKKSLEYIKKMDGFIGIHPVDVWHNLLIYRSLNDAKRARNDLISKGVSMGQVAPILVEERWARK